MRRGRLVIETNNKKIDTLNSPLAVSTTIPTKRKKNSLKNKLWRDRYLLLLILPGVLYFVIYRYIPMAGILLAFKDYSPFKGFVDSPWVGLKYFKLIFEDTEVIQVIWNTLQISMLQIFFAFPISIVLALMLNEIRNQVYKKFLQSIVYLPHFLSWVVVVGITVIFLRSEGLVNSVLVNFLDINPIQFLTDPAMFKPIVIFQVIWKESGWGTILFLAALSGVSPHLYEAAVIDGASRLRQMWHITLPALKSTIVILLILRLGNVMDTGFEQIFLMLNPFNMETGNVLDTYVYFKGIQQANFSFATAVGLFKGIIGLVLVVLANRLAKKFGEEGLY